MAARVCAICDRQFSKAEHLKRHERSHTRSKPYKCHICHKSFGRSDVLLRHCKKHEQDAQDRAKAVAINISQSPGHAPNQQESPSTRSSFSSVRSTVAAAGLMPLSSDARAVPMAVDESFWSSDPMIGTTTPMNTVAVSAASTSAGLNVAVGGQSYSVLPGPSIAVDAQHNMDHVGIHDPEILMAVLTPPDDTTLGPRKGPMVMPLESLEHMSEFDSFGIGADLFPHRNHQGAISDLSQFEFDRPWWFGSDREQLAVQGDSNNMGSSLQRPSRPEEPAQAHISNGAAVQTITQLDPMPEEQWSRLEHFWSRSGDRSTRLMSTLWQDLLAGNGLFCSEPGQEPPKHSPELTSPWSLDIATRNRVHAAFCTLLDLRDSGNNEVVIPGPDMFDVAFEQYVYHHHKMVPIFHLATFHAKQAPTSLLLVACTIGLNIIGNAELIRLVCKVFPKLIEVASDELHASSAKNTILEKRLTAMITATLSLCLSSLISHRVRINQSESLCISLLSKAQVDGLFMAHDYPLCLSKLETLPPTERCWRVWASIETVKRLIIELIQLDCWYSTHLAVHLSLRSEDVHVVPPCHHSLLMARTCEEWARKRPDFAAMDCPAISATSTTHAQLPDWANTISTRLMLQQLRLVEAYSILERHVQTRHPKSQLLPWTFFNDDARCQSLVDTTVQMAYAANEGAPDFDINAAVSWHAHCLSLGCYIPLFETAAGRMGPAAAKAALRDISTWAHTPSARRCCLHAARIYNLLLNRRFSDAIRLHSMVALFQASLVLGLYVFVMPDPGRDEVFNLIEDEIDWPALGAVGISNSTDNDATASAAAAAAAGRYWDPASSSTATMTTTSSHSAAARFVLDGGRMCMADATISGGYVQARKCWLLCVHLMLSLGRWNSRVFSRILHVMADSLTDLETGGVDDAGHQQPP